MNMKDKIKLIAIDFDGTFLDDTHYKHNLSYVDKIFETGKKIVFASGRGTAGIVTLIEKLGIKDKVRYVIGHNGAEIYDVLEEKIIYQNIIDDEIAFGIINLVINAGFTNPISIHKWNKLITYNYDKRVDLENKVNFTTGYEIDDIKDFPKEKLKLMFFATGKEVNDIYDLINNSKYSTKVTQARNENILVEVTAKGINKANALKHLVGKLGIEMNEILAFGNAENDIDMIKEVGYGYAMKNSVDSLKKVAKYITKYDNNDCGVEREIIDIFYN